MSCRVRRSHQDTENPLFSIDLKQCTIQLTSDEQASANCFEITSGNKDRWFIKASDEETMVDWMIAMRKVKADMQALANPPFSPEIVQQFSPVLASAAPPLPAKPSSSTYDATPAPPTPASPPLTGEEEEDFYNSALSSSAGGDVYQGGYLHESGDYYAQEDYHGGGDDDHQNYGGGGDGNNDQAW